MERMWRCVFVEQRRQSISTEASSIGTVVARVDSNGSLKSVGSSITISPLPNSTALTEQRNIEAKHNAYSPIFPILLPQLPRGWRTK